jgi:hypothetical protein
MSILIVAIILILVGNYLMTLALMTGSPTISSGAILTVLGAWILGFDIIGGIVALIRFLLMKSQSNNRL